MKTEPKEIDSLEALEHVENLHRQQLEDALVNIFDAINGREWSPDTCDEIARIFAKDLGLPIAEPCEEKEKR